jgi:NAD-dependent dihydropyrimidine dehydrogenase PreA subunit
VTYVIAEPCIDVKDKSCIEVCPVDCIYTDDDDRICYIHPTECIDCNACLPACPVGAIYTDDSLPEESRPFLAVNRSWFEDRARTRAMVDRLAELLA